MYLRKYGAGTGADVIIPMVKRGAVDFAVAADWTPAAGDVTISKDGGAAANISTLPVAVAMGNGAAWKFTFTNAELQAKYITITVVDGSPKAVEDQMFIIETFGNAAALYPGIDLSDSVRLGMTALPNAAAASSGGLPTVNASNFIAGIAGTKNTLDSLHDLSTADVAATLASGGLDAPVSSRLAAASYIAPDNSDAAAAAAGVADLLARLTSARAALLDSLSHLDADVSSRLAAAGYVAPDNAGIASIETGIASIGTGVASIAAKTDNLPANPAAVGSAMTLDMSQLVPITNLPQTVGDALNAARAEGFGPWSLDVPTKTMTLFAADGITPVHSFTWDDAENPTSRN